MFSVLKQKLVKKKKNKDKSKDGKSGKSEVNGVSVDFYKF